MNNHIKGFRRDNAIVQAVDEWQVLNTEQIQMLFFQNTSLRMAQKRLHRLIEKGKVRRQRDYIGQPFYYYTDRLKGQVNHMLGVNWVRLWLLRNLKSWENLYCWQYEPDYKVLRPDGLMGIKNTITDTIRFCFIERECDTNPFKKVKLYNEFYENGGYGSCWWTEKAEKFPAIVVVVESSTRLLTVQKLIERDNKHGLNFKAYLLSQLINELKGGEVV